jgi:phosphoribosylformylglycinamidine cyclo-ligase
MFRVFNMGVGLVMIVSNFHADAIRRILSDQQLTVWRIGDVVEGGGTVSFVD